ncbi:hypothetical protein JHK86_010037 [Glycine max]|nr:hypothetical protein JHK86_010037 [Glycine max]
MSKHNLWVECEEHKKSLKLWNDELLKNQEFKGQPQHVVKLDEGIRTLKTTLSKFVNRIDNLKKLLGYYKISLDKSGNGYNGKVYVHDENTILVNKKTIASKVLGVKVVLSSDTIVKAIGCLHEGSTYQGKWEKNYDSRVTRALYWENSDKVND